MSNSCVKIDPELGRYLMADVWVLGERYPGGRCEPSGLIDRDDWIVHSVEQAERD